MRRKMLISSLVVYAVAFSCLTLLLGKTLASTAVEMTVKQEDERRPRVVINQVKSEYMDRAKSVEEKSADGARVVKTAYLPSKFAVRKPDSAPGTANESRAYFAIFDAVIGETHTFPVLSNVSDGGSSLEVPRHEPKFYGKLRERNGDRKHRRWSKFQRRKLRNFVSRDVLKDSEMELRIHFEGVTAKETMISAGIDENTGKRQGLKLRQLTDGKNFIQLIYNMDDEIQDCEFIRRKDLVAKFLKEFQSDVKKAEVAYEIESEVYGVGDKEIDSAKDGHFKDPDMKFDEEEYFEEDEGGIESYRVFQEKKEEEEELENMDSPYQIRNVTFLIIQKEEDFPRDIAEWLNYQKLRKNCKRTQKVLKRLVHHSQNGDVESKKLARKRLERKKRDLMDVFRMPGTKWCGKGKRAAKYTSLGVFSRTDKCCRIHDTVCPYWIGGFQEKYGLFNWKLNTIMHCRCDKRFRACLKMAKTGAANLVGKVFFNIVQTQCFVLKPEEVCVKMSWWGKCEKKEYRKKAYLRDNVPY